MRVKIDKNIPLPDWIGGGYYPFKEMKVGDSFLHPGTTASASSASQSAALRMGNGTKFSCRKVEGGTRIWRTA